MDLTKSAFDAERGIRDYNNVVALEHKSGTHRQGTALVCSESQRTSMRCIDCGLRYRDDKACLEVCGVIRLFLPRLSGRRHGQISSVVRRRFRTGAYVTLTSVDVQSRGAGFNHASPRWGTACQIITATGQEDGGRSNALQARHVGHAHPCRHCLGSRSPV